MTRVALFRSSPFQDDHVLRALGLVSDYVDVFDRRDVQINRVTLTSAEIQVRGLPLSDFSHALLLGHPDPSPLRAARLEPPERDFEACEWSAALSSGLVLGRARVLNRGTIDGAAAALATKPGQVTFLAKLGWKVASLRLTRTAAGEETRSYGCDLGRLRRCFLCFTAHHELVFPVGALTGAVSRRELDAVTQTRRAMQSLGLDWLSLALGVQESRVIAFGASTDIPAELGDVGTAAILSSCLPMGSALQSSNGAGRVEAPLGEREDRLCS